MRCGKKKRGSVILLVVGLLTILAMLGSALLISSHLDAKQSRALAQHAPADPIAEGLVAQLKQILRRDLDLTAADGPYGLGDPNARPWPHGSNVDLDGNGSDEDVPWNNERGWKAYIDSPLAPTEVGDSDYDIVDPWLVDRWLASNDLNDNPWAFEWSYSHISDLTGELTAAQTTRPRFTRASPNDPWTLEIDNGSGYAPDPTRRPVDTDGDGHPDALLVDSGVINAEGQRYYFAVRVTDLSGKICVNTAAQSATPTLPTSPVYVELELFIGAAEYTLLDGARITGNPSLDEFFTDSASKLFAPIGNYLPFAIGEEAYLLWLSDNISSAGRLPNLNADLREHLTTFSVTRDLVRSPSSGDPNRPLFIETDENRTSPPPTETEYFLSNDPVRGPEARQEVYVRMLEMLDRLGIGIDFENREYMAAHFVANLWAYQDDIDNLDATDHWRFRPTRTRRPGLGNPQSWEVYGLVQDLVITEAYARHEAESAPDAKDWAWGSAIEIFNPTTDRNLDLNNDYKLVLAGTVEQGEYDLAPVILGPGQRLVIYNFAAGDLSGFKDDPEGFFGGSFPAADKYWNTNLSFMGPGLRLYKIVRIVDPGPPVIRVPVDEVSNSELGYQALDEFVLNPDEEDIQRDDRLTVGGVGTPPRARYNFAEYTDDESHTLGAQNGLVDDNTADLSDVDSAEIVHKGVPGDPVEINDIGELSLIYLTGPLNDDILGVQKGNYQYLHGFPQQLAGFTTLGIGPVQGRMDLHPDSVGASGTYPDVPPAAFWSEFFTLLPTDATRGDNDRRIYGRININTASREVLAQLPWPSTMSENDIYNAVSYIIAYRDRRRMLLKPFGWTVDYRTGRDNAGPTGVNSLRAGSDFAGFLTAGEIAVPLADYAIAQGLVEEDADFAWQRDQFYRPISNLITVNSDVYAVNIRVDVYDPDETPEGGYEPQHSWYYIAVIDRSNCMGPNDTPAVLMFSEVR